MEVLIENLTKKFGENYLFVNFNLSISSGDFISIVGKSGCGKTTLLNIIGLLDDDYSGTIKYDGHILKNNKTKRKFLKDDVSYVFQNYGLVDNETVYYNMVIPLNIKRLKKEEQRERINHALKYVGLEGFQDRKVYELSGGEQQRVSLAKVFLKKPALILADEPTASLDPTNEKIVMNLLQDLNKNGSTLILVTHNERIANYSKFAVQIGGKE